MWTASDFTGALIGLALIIAACTVGLEHCGSYVFHHVSVGWK